MSENDVRDEDRFDLLEGFLNWRSDVGKKAIAKGFHNDRLVLCAVQEGVGAALGFLGARRIGTEDEPIELDALRLLDHSQYRATAAYLDVVAVCPQAKYSL